MTFAKLITPLCLVAHRSQWIGGYCPVCRIQRQRRTYVVRPLDTVNYSLCLIAPDGPRPCRNYHCPSETLRAYSCYDLPGAIRRFSREPVAQPECDQCEFWR